MNAYNTGHTVTLDLTFYNDDGDLVQPSNIVVEVIRPNGTLVLPAPEVTFDSETVGHLAITSNASGIWKWRVMGITIGKTIVWQGNFYARPV